MTGDLTGAAGDRRQNARRGNHLVVEHDGEQPPDILRRDLAEFLRAANIEAEIDDGLAAALVEAGLRVGQILALHHDLLLDAHFAALVGLLQFLGFRGALAGFGDETEFELGGLAKDRLQLLGVLQARHLHDDAVVALTLDARLARAERVDAAADHLDRLIDGAADFLGEAGVGHDDAHEAVAVVVDFERRRAGAEPVGVALGQRFQLGDDLGAVGGVRDAHLHAARLLPDAARRRHLLLAQNPPRVVAQIHRQRVQHGRFVDLQHDVGAALQVEAQHDRRGPRPVRKTRRERLVIGRRQQTWRDDKHRGERHRQNRDDFPFGETQHCLPYSCGIWILDA